MDSFSADAKQPTDIDLADVRAQVKALEETHRANNIPLSGRVIHVCHYLPVTATLANPAPSGLPSPPKTPVDGVAPGFNGSPRWKLAPRIGHSAMTSGIRSLSATHEQVIVGWTGDVYAPAPTPAVASPSVPANQPAMQTPAAAAPEPQADVTAEVIAQAPPAAAQSFVRVPSASLSAEDREALGVAVEKYEAEPESGESEYLVGETKQKGDKKISLVPVWLDDKVAHGHYEGYCKTSECPSHLSCGCCPCASSFSPLHYQAEASPSFFRAFSSYRNTIHCCRSSTLATSSQIHPI
jgi:trehalose 6-phosphate synthase/phosphatase